MYTTILHFISGSADVSYKIGSLQHLCKVSKNSRKILEEKLQELWTNIVDFKRKCSPRDRTLCDSLLSTPISTTFDVSDVSFSNFSFSLNKSLLFFVHKK